MSETPPPVAPTSKGRSVLVGAAKLALTVVVFGALGVLLYRERALFASALDMAAEHFLIIATFTLASWIASALAQQAILRALGRPLPFVEVLSLHVGGGLLNHLPMRPGMLYRAHFLKERTGLLYAHFASFTAVNVLVPVGAAGLLAAIALATSHGVRSDEALLLLSLLLVLTLSCAVVLVVPLPALRGGSRVVKVWNELLVGRSTIARYPRAVVVVVLCHAASVLFGALRYHGAYASLEVDVAFSTLVILGATDKVSTLLSITPGGIGIQELAAAATGKLLGIDFALGVVAASVVRAVLLICYVVLGSAGLLLLRAARSARAAKE